MADTDARRDFHAVLDAVEQGEEIVLTRDGVPIARLEPVPKNNIADRIDEVMRSYPADPAWADELEAVVREPRAEPSQERVWDLPGFTAETVAVS